MKLIKTTEAAGTMLCHDITHIIRGVTKDAVFRKGHIVTEEDIPVLLSVGKDQLYVWEKQEGMLHEDEAAEILCRMCTGDSESAEAGEDEFHNSRGSCSGKGTMERSRPKEGKIEIRAACDGLLSVNSAALRAVNSLGQMMIATRHGGFAVRKGDKIAGTRIIPLVIEKEKMAAAERVCREASGGEPILQVHPFHHKKIGIVTTGNEVYYGRIEDAFTPVIKEKFAEYDTEIIAHEVWNDDASKVTDAVLRMIGAGADIVCCTGGMSVDPDDRTPLAIRNTGARIVSYGAPVLPGAMFLLAYYEVPGTSEPAAGAKTFAPPDSGNGCSRRVPILGLPGCVMYAKRTIFDLVLPRLMADDEISAQDLAGLGEGGLCLNCPVCTFPNCGFGKGR